MANTTVDKILKLPGSQKITILIVIMAALCAAFVYYVFMPQMETLKSKKEQYSKYQTQFNEQQNILSNLPRFRQELKTIQTEFENSLKLLPNSREIPTLLSNITNLAQESGLEINLFRPKPEVPQDFYAQIPVEMKVTGRYHQIGLFFDKLAKLPRIINITDIAMSQKSAGAAKGSTTAVSSIDSSFNATTFKFIESTGKVDAGKKKKIKK